MTKVGSKPGQAAHTAASSYADPGYLADGLKRYALDSGKEAAAAASYFSRNKGKYTPAQQAAIEKRIKAAEASFGIGLGK